MMNIVNMLYTLLDEVLVDANISLISVCIRTA